MATKDNVTPIKGAAKPDLHSIVMDHAWRMDDVARTLDKVHERLDDHEKVASGMVPTMLTMMGAEIDKRVAAAIDKYKSEDKAQDLANQEAQRKQVADLLARHDEGEMEITKHGTVETPDGIHKMTVTETRKRKT